MRVKKLLSILLVLCMVLAWAPVSVSAEETASGTCGENIEWVLEDGVLLISGTGPMYDFLDENGDSTAPWYEYRTDISSIEMSNGITSIGAGAFYGCYHAKNFILSEDLVTIGDRAFYVSGVENLVIPEGVTEIGDSVFHFCHMQSIYFPSTLKQVDYWGFGNNGFGNVSEIHVSDMETWCNIQFNGSTPFYGLGEQYLYIAGELVTDIVIPYGVTEIKDEQFHHYVEMTSISIPNTVTRIGDYAFAFDGYYDYLGERNVKEVVIPVSVTYIGRHAFYEHDNLEKIVIWNPNCEIDYSMYSAQYYSCYDVCEPDENGNYNVIVGYEWFDQREEYENRGITCTLPVIYGWPGSTAEAYAEFAGFEFVPLESYEFVDGMGQTWIKESNEALSFEINADASKSVEIQVNGVTLAEENYTVTEGSTIVTLKPEYLETLPVGEYTMTIVFTDGSATGVFTIEEKPIITGDVNDDGVINMFDAAKLVAYYTGSAELTEEQQAAADINNDGVINMFDAAKVVSYYTGKISSFE